MLVRDARAAAREWVEQERKSVPGFYGAYLAGSVSSMPADAVLPGASDVDIKVVVDDSTVNPEPQKFVYHGVVFDVSHASRDDVSTAEGVLGNYYTAVHFAHPSVLSDPTGHLTELQAIVAREYPRRVWVRKRAEHARAFIQGMLESSPFPEYDAAQTCLLRLQFTPPMVLVADLRNPTHRRCIVNCHQVLDRYNHSELHEQLLGIMGSAALTWGEVELLLANCAEAFDTAKLVRKTPFLMASNISDFAHPMVIGGARELIDQGYHREAVVWIAFMHTLCTKIIENDAPDDVKRQFDPAYQRMLETLGLSTSDQVADKEIRLGHLIPELWRVTEAIIATNPAIRD